MKEAEISFSFPTEVVREGEISFVAPRLEAFVDEPWEYAPSKAPVFYNPIMELNRDLAVLALQAYQKMRDKKIAACEPLSGCGVRGVRFALEVEGISRIVLNDINEEAVRLAEFNVQRNNLGDRISVANGDANLLLSSYAAPRRRFDCIDIDPFGSPVAYIDSAIRALRDHGFLALTATDLAPLCGVHPRACIRKYGGRPLRTEYCHELAVRLLTGCLTTMAAKHGMGVRVLLSHSTDHYIRVYAIANYGAKRADISVQKIGHILHCFTCLHRETSSGIISSSRQECIECGAKVSAAGPLWLGKTSNKEFCALMIKELKERNLRNQKIILKLLSLSRDEAEASPTYYVTDKICDKLDLPIPPIIEVMEKLRNSGYEATSTSFCSRGIRTDAPAKVVKNITARLVT
ncbi:MAG: tRNA (guanine(10)-N(2))-dimethyltransferase [Candidatus Bathyarchaeota archaeon]|nr:MAG: tRNA (guanine(10)-N(2))-dimethyltransferase [Candidatus Bathyarchaeota archaeon]